MSEREYVETREKHENTVAGEDEKASHTLRMGDDSDHKERDPVKMVLCVNADLKMSKGKIGAQCAHAAVGAVEMIAADISDKKNTEREKVMRWWKEACGQAKIVLRVEGGEQKMLDLAHAAFGKGMSVYGVRDAGRTQVPSSSLTVVAIGPAPSAVIDEVTRGLPLM